MISAEYIWTGGKNTHTDLRSKTRTLYVDDTVMDVLSRIVELKEEYIYDGLNTVSAEFNHDGKDILLTNYIPEWNFDGSSTDQASCHGDTEIILKPCAICFDPFRGTPNIMVLCDCYLPNGNPHTSNTRWEAAKIFETHRNKLPWFGLEQEYFLHNMGSSIDDFSDFTIEIGKFYCGNGADKVFARDIMEDHYQKCLNAGLKISGYNAEVMPKQYEYQIGPAEGIYAADQLIFARFIMTRICERRSMLINYDPKPIENGNGSGLHHNFSTQDMRNDNGYKYILEACQKLKYKHEEHLTVYGDNNDRRLTGKHETSSMTTFTWGVGTRNTSVRIPNQTFLLQRGYLEDRRPAANVDPYLSTSKLLLTCVE